MTAYDVAKWKICEVRAMDMGIKITARTTFVLHDKKGLILGNVGTVDELFAFLCGYEHSVKKGSR